MNTKNQKTKMTKQVKRIVTIRLNEDIHACLIIKAAQEKRNISNFMAWIISNFIEEKYIQPAQILEEKNT